MNPIVAKVLPWAIAALAVLGAIVMYGSQREAAGRVEALTELYVEDSTENAKREQLRQDSLTVLQVQLASERESRVRIKATADHQVKELRETLNEEQQALLDALVASHEAERSSWQTTEKKLSAQLALKDDRIADLEDEKKSLIRINTELEDARPGFLTRATPIATMVAVAGAVLLLAK